MNVRKCTCLQQFLWFQRMSEIKVIYFRFYFNFDEKEEQRISNENFNHEIANFYCHQSLYFFYQLLKIGYYLQLEGEKKNQF